MVSILSMMSTQYSPTIDVLAALPCLLMMETNNYYGKFFFKCRIWLLMLQEVEVERDVFAGEIGRLQKVVRRLRALHASTCSENKELGRMREKLFRLECANQRLGHCISVRLLLLRIALVSHIYAPHGHFWFVLFTFSNWPYSF